MVKYKVFEEEEAEEEKTIHFKLKQEEETVKLIAVSKQGETLNMGYILRLYPKEGKIYIYDCINKEIGLKKVRVPNDMKTE